MQALALYYLLNRCVMNVDRIIVIEMDEIAQSRTKKSLGHASVIILLCRKAGVPDFTNGRIMNLKRPLGVGWIEEHPRRKALVEDGTMTQKRPTDTSPYPNMYLREFLLLISWTQRSNAHVLFYARFLCAYWTSRSISHPSSGRVGSSSAL